MDFWDWFDIAGKTFNEGAGMAWDGLLDAIGIDENRRKQAINNASTLPIVGPMLQTMDQNQKMQDYMKNTGLTWADVKYPALVSGGLGSIVNSFSTGTNFVSRNLDRLYNTKKKGKK